MLAQVYLRRLGGLNHQATVGPKLGMKWLLEKRRATLCGDTCNPICDDCLPNLEHWPWTLSALVMHSSQIEPTLTLSTYKINCILCVYNIEIPQRIQSYTKAPSDPTCGNRTADSLSWGFSPLPDSKVTFSYKFVDTNPPVFADCDESGSKCTASDLSAGTVYTAYLIACFNDTADGTEICSDKSPQGISCATSPNPPTNVQVEPNSSDSVQVTINVPNDPTGIVRYSACIDGKDSLCIDLEGGNDIKAGVIGGLSPATKYLVNTQSWLGDNFIHVGSSISSETGWTLPITPSNCNITEITSNSLSVKCSIETKRSVSNEALVTTVMAKTVGVNSTSQNCSISNSDNSCTIRNLQACTGYSVSLITCIGNIYCGNVTIICENISTDNSSNVELIVALVVVCAILVVLAILLAIFWKRIKSLRHRIPVVQNQNDVNSFIITYFEPEELYTSVDILHPPIAFDNYQDYVRSLQGEGQMANLFKYLNNLTKEQEENFHLSTDAANMVGSQNRYRDILPYDQSLVILGRKWPMPLTDPRPKSISGLLSAAYMNASFVRRPRHTPTGCAVPATYSQPPEYISTQGPLENTVADYLTMIYQQRVPQIVMLCRNKEDMKEKCARYWPNDSNKGAMETFTSGRHTVTVVHLEIELLETGVRRVFTIRPHDEKDPWTVTQIQTFVWNDYQCMNMDKFYELLQKHMELNIKYPIGEYGPPVVHCSAGVGRTGTFICGRFLLEQLRKDPSKIDVIGTVLALRRWRMHMVQNEYAWPLLHLQPKLTQIQ
ncbi:hypothetical protein ACTXT7_004282 [Hymenolepis weldensis]